MRWLSRQRPAARTTKRKNARRLWRRPTVMLGLAIVLMASGGAAGVMIWRSGWVERAAADTKWRLITGTARIGPT